jgi:hypothetical protein
MPSLGELLTADGVCGQRQIEDAIRNQVILGGRLGTNLVELGVIDEATLAHYLARQHDTPALYGEDIQPEPAALALMEAQAVDRLDVIPFIREHKRLQLLCVDPADLKALDEAAFITGLKTDPIVVPEIRFWQLLRRCYGIERQLRYIAINTRDFMAGALADEAPLAPPPAAEPPAEPAADLMGEDDFAQLYQRRDGFPQLSRPPPAAPSEQMPVLAPEDLEEIDEPAPAAPPGGIERRVWQAERPESGRRVGDHHLAEQVGAPPSQPPAPAVDDSPLDFEAATALLPQARDRHQIARIVLRFARSQFRRAMLFTVHRGVALGWDALGEGLDPLSFRSLMIPLDGLSVFRTVVETRAHYLGGLHRSRTNIEFLRATGRQVPLSAFVIPVLVRGRVVNLLYADNGHKAHSPNDIGELLILAQHISRSYEALFERKRAAYESNRSERGD